MRRFLLLPIVAAAFAATAIPANAQYLIQGCAAGDYRVVDVEAAGRELVEVCTTDDPTPILQFACRICPPPK